jgi:hypothetical protein
MYVTTDFCQPSPLIQLHKGRKSVAIVTVTNEMLNYAYVGDLDALYTVVVTQLLKDLYSVYPYPVAYLSGITNLDMSYQGFCRLTLSKQLHEANERDKALYDSLRLQSEAFLSMLSAKDRKELGIN